MKELLIILLSLIKHIVSQSSNLGNLGNVSQRVCPQIVCNNTYSYPTNNTCYNFTNDSILYQGVIGICPSYQSCNLNFISDFSSNSAPRNPVYCQNTPINIFSGLQIGNLVDQDFCSVSSDCASQKCINNTCIGFPSNSACSTTYQCSSGLFCQSGVCVSQKQVGSSCTSNEQCVNFAGCLNGVCVGYYSIPSGGSLGSTNANDATNYCASGYVNQNGICEDLILTVPAPYLCDPSIGCTYNTSITGQTVKLNSCTCDLNGNGNAYCYASTNSLSYQGLVSAKISVLSKSQCHYFNRNKCASSNMTIIDSLNQINNSLKGISVSSTAVQYCNQQYNFSFYNPGYCQSNYNSCVQMFINSTTISFSKVIFVNIPFFILFMLFIF